MLEDLWIWSFLLSLKHVIFFCMFLVLELLDNSSTIVDILRYIKSSPASNKKKDSLLDCNVKLPGYQELKQIAMIFCKSSFAFS